MAILKSVVDVNNGNTGWDKSDVLDALETVFANLGTMEQQLLVCLVL